MILLQCQFYRIYFCLSSYSFSLLAFPFSAFSLSTLAQAIMPLTFILEVPGSNLGRQTDYPEFSAAPSDEF
jgi:hypothetical protein